MIPPFRIYRGMEFVVLKQHRPVLAVIILGARLRRRGCGLGAVFVRGWELGTRERRIWWRCREGCRLMGREL